MGLSFGTNNISEVDFGSTSIGEIWLGNTQLWSSGPPRPTTYPGFYASIGNDLYQCQDNVNWFKVASNSMFNTSNLMHAGNRIGSIISSYVYYSAYPFSSSSSAERFNGTPCFCTSGRVWWSGAGSSKVYQNTMVAIGPHYSGTGGMVQIWNSATNSWLVLSIPDYDYGIGVSIANDIIFINYQDDSSTYQMIGTNDGVIAGFNTLYTHTDGYYYAMAYNSTTGTYYAHGKDSAQAIAAYSTDLSTWTYQARYSSLGTNYITNIVQANGIYVASMYGIYAGVKPIVRYSTDGYNFLVPSQGINYVRTGIVAASTNGFIASPEELGASRSVFQPYYSTDGNIWTAMTFPVSTQRTNHNLIYMN